ncbi:hypothetical protein [Pseudoruegeria sp. SK021]|uniref:hypothetical protein n=1 Tax=Pseudoruegeria sp. SK021 TaxID=1933035 RepID=UPI000A264407|nr:hypothetical protein [Pseudoruegeria sp. SK021]OSP52878.1 hypothetical protein BV911_18565 [Pseudoruegeria sp. SK021]
MSRATLGKALQDGKISAEKTDAGHWRIDPAELARVYRPRTQQKAVERPMPDHLGRDDPNQKAAADQDMAARLAKAEAELAAEREKTALLERHLDDVRRMLPPPDAKLRRWWPW